MDKRMDFALLVQLVLQQYDQNQNNQPAAYSWTMFTIVFLLLYEAQYWIRIFPLVHLPSLNDKSLLTFLAVTVIPCLQIRNNYIVKWLQNSIYFIYYCSTMPHADIRYYKIAIIVTYIVVVLRVRWQQVSN